MLYLASVGQLLPLPFLALFQFGFLYLGLSSLRQQQALGHPVLREQVASD